MVNGRLRVNARQATGEERILAELGRGETVGEMAILGGEHRSATVSAIRDTNLARLSRENFERLSARYPQEIAPIFIRKIIARLQQEIQEYYWDFIVTSDLLELRNIATVGELIVKSALQRPESRGLNYNLDYPQPNPEWAQQDTVLRK